MPKGTRGAAAAAALPPSLWAATARPAPDTPPLQGHHEAEVCIIGGGFTGLSAALHLAEGGTRVVLLESAEPGWGASGRNGGQVIPGFKLDPDTVEACFGDEMGGRMVELVGGAADFVFGLIAKHRIDCEAEQCGWIQAAHAPAGFKLAQARVEQWSRRGAPVSLLEKEQVTRLTGAKGYAGGLLDERGGKLQPLSYARGLARAALLSGATIHGQSPARKLAKENGGWRVETTGGSVRAQQVLLCTNGYTDGLWPGLARSVIPLYSYQAATRPLSHNLQRTILSKGQVCSDARRLLAYFRLDSSGRLIIGGRGRNLESSQPRHYRHITTGLAALFPQLGEPTWDYFWGGRIALTLDHLPHLHEPAPGLLVGHGYNGRGVAMASVMGKVLAERAQGRQPAELPFPVTPLRAIPLHSLRRPAISATVAWKRLRDRWEMREN